MKRGERREIGDLEVGESKQVQGKRKENETRGNGREKENMGIIVQCR